MSLLDFFLIVAALSLAGVAIALVPALLQVKRTAQKAEILIETLNREFAPLLHSLAETARELHNLTAGVNEKMDKMDTVIETMDNTSQILRSTAAMIKQTVIPVASSIGGLGAGINAFIKYFSKSGTK